MRDLYAAALGHDVSATNLQRVLVRRGLLEATGETREPGNTGGRPAALFRFTSQQLDVTDQFAVLKPAELGDADAGGELAGDRMLGFADANRQRAAERCDCAELDLATRNEREALQIPE